MTLPTKQDILKALEPVEDPDLDRSLVKMGMLDVTAIETSGVKISIELSTPMSEHQASISEAVDQALGTLGFGKADVSFGWKVTKAPPLGDREDILPGVKNVILVGSGKGGVGKSTVAVNLAVSLAKAGAKVGLLDADIYGPSIPIMLGVRGAKPKSSDGKSILPVRAHGVDLISIGFFVDPEQAMIWRGPMLNGAITQFFRDVDWGELDYLVLDLPPGTGDIQLTIAQQLQVAGAVIVTTPQDLALADAIKAKAMFDKVDVPVLGIVENMSYFACPHCGERTEIFNHGGGAAAAEKLALPFLGEIPLVMEVRTGGDEGVPVVVGQPDLPAAKALSQVAFKAAAQVTLANLESTPTVVGPPPPGQPLVSLGVR